MRMKFRNKISIFYGATVASCRLTAERCIDHRRHSSRVANSVAFFSCDSPSSNFLQGFFFLGRRVAPCVGWLSTVFFARKKKKNVSHLLGAGYGSLLCGPLYTHTHTHTHTNNREKGVFQRPTHCFGGWGVSAVTTDRRPAGRRRRGVFGVDPVGDCPCSWRGVGGSFLLKKWSATCSNHRRWCSWRSATCASWTKDFPVMDYWVIFLFSAHLLIWFIRSLMLRHGFISLFLPPETLIIYLILIVLIVFWFILTIVWRTDQFYWMHNGW